MAQQNSDLLLTLEKCASCMSKAEQVHLNTAHIDSHGHIRQSKSKTVKTFERIRLPKH
jgi:hypothetical protein